MSRTSFAVVAIIVTVLGPVAGADAAEIKVLSVPPLRSALSTLRRDSKAKGFE